MMKKAVVTGGSGFIGLAVVKELRRSGIEVTVISRNRSRDAELAGANCLQGDIRDAAFLAEAFDSHDTVFHVAAKAGIWGSLRSYYEINVLGTGNVIKACRKNGIDNLVYTSTPSVVFDGRDIRGGTETLSYGRKVLCHYARTKILAERLVMQSNDEQLRTTALRPHLVWGPGDTNLIPRLIARGRSGSLKKVGSGRNLVDISYIDNVVSAHLLAARNLQEEQTAAGKAFFISLGQPVVLWDWIDDLFRRIGIAPVCRKVPFRVAYLVGGLLELLYTIQGREEEPPMTRFLAEQLAKDHYFSTWQAENILHYQPAVSTAEGLERLTTWLKKNNMAG